ncbi:MAG TPA: ATP-binding protein, partial [Flavisolibacter sp.]|nr:ATP-binding protein [Flavisolibacter sp.]
FTLKSADHAYRVFIEKMTEGALTINQQGIILYANSQFAAMTSRPLSDVIGLPFHTLVTQSSRPFYETLFHNCWTADCKGEVQLTSGDGVTPVQLSLTTIELETGVSVSIILTDLTLQKAAQKQLEENNRQLERMNGTLEASNHDLQQFASVASHDLQEPLRKIQMFAKLMKERCAQQLKEADIQYLEKIISAAGRMKMLVVDVLNYSRLSAKDGDVLPINLDVLLQELLEDFELMIEEKGATINVVGPLPVLEVNPGQMRQVFQNLLSNALKFSKKDEAPQIRVSAKRLAEKKFDSAEQTGGAFCLLSIKDNGIGFDEKHATNIFSLFERLHSKDQYEGTGIGLAITKKIVEKHKGLITVQSTEGNGSEFLIILPLHKSDSY